MSAPPTTLDRPSSPTSAPKDRWTQVRADAALLLVSAVWGGTFVMVKDALATTGPFTFLALRFALAALAMAPLVASVKRSRLALRRSAPLALAGSALGLVLFAGYGFQTAGLQHTIPARAGFVTGVSVVFVPLLASLVLRTRVTRTAWTGVGLAVVGLALLSLGQDLLAGGPLLSADTAFGDLLVLGCAVAFAIQIVLVGEFAPRFEGLALTFLQFAVAALLGLAFALALEPLPTVDQLGAVLPAALFTGLFATVGAFLVQIWAQRFTPSTHTALIFSTEPVFGAVFAYLLIGEVLAPAALVGCVFILVGMLLAQIGD